MLEEIMRVCDQKSIVFAWQEGDVLLLDNMLTAHGRRPFVGKRKVVVGMAQSNQVAANQSLLVDVATIGSGV